MFWPFSSTPHPALNNMSAQSTESTAASTTKNKPTSFLDLPAELRNEIYRLAIPSGATITHDETFSSHPIYSTDSTRNGLVDIGGQIGAEAATFFYADNKFEFTSFPTTFAFLVTLGEGKRALIRDLRLTCPEPAKKVSYEERAEGTPLKSHLLAVAAFAGALKGNGLKGLDAENVFVDIRWMLQGAETYCRLTEFPKMLVACRGERGRLWKETLMEEASLPEWNAWLGWNED